jgi:SAM-dependent methyltransferase
VTGLDISPTAVDQLSARFSQHRFLVGDLGSGTSPVQGAFDLISAMSVLLHIVDDARFRRALRTMAELLNEGGSILLMEPLVLHRWWGRPFDETSNSKARGVDEWRRVLMEAGLELVDHVPVTALLANVCDTRSMVTWKAHQVYWGALRIIMSRLPTAVVRPLSTVLGRLDRVLVARGAAPSAKVMLVRRRPATPTRGS